MLGKQVVADQVNQRRLVDSFIELAQVNGPSGDEETIAAYVQNKLETLGFIVKYDEAQEQTGGNCGNLFAWYEGKDSSLSPLFFSTHLDTVLPTKDLKPVIRSGKIYSDGTTILGADDRAAIAAYLEAVRTIQENNFHCGPIELIFTVSEQTSLLGSKYLDYSRVKSKKGYVFDSSGDVGQIILGGPFGKYLHWTISGRRAHLGLSAADGVSAIEIAAKGIAKMRLGQVNEITVANIGKIQGGELGSIIPAQAEMLGEVRSYTLEGLDAQVAEMDQHVKAAAEKLGGTTEVRLEKKYIGYDIPENDNHVQLAVRAANRLGIRPHFTRTLGGADTNNFRENGLNVFTLGNGFRDIHSFHEHISIRNLVDTARLTVSLIEEYTATELKRS